MIPDDTFTADIEIEYDPDSDRNISVRLPKKLTCEIQYFQDHLETIDTLQDVGEKFIQKLYLRTEQFSCHDPTFCLNLSNYDDDSSWYGSYSSISPLDAGEVTLTVILDT